MEIENTPLEGVFLIKPKVFGDKRGFFLETWSDSRFIEAGFDQRFVQDNHSRSTRGILRGLHFQSRQPQGKLVWVASGSVFDVVVDCRTDSPTYGGWFGHNLTSNSHEQLWIPPGCAHGFYVLSDYADFLYKCTNYYRAESEVCLKWNDPTVNIKWPIFGGTSPILSDKDQMGLEWSALPFINHASSKTN